MLILRIWEDGTLSVHKNPFGAEEIAAIEEGLADYIRFNFAEHCYEHAEVIAGKVIWQEITNG